MHDIYRPHYHFTPPRMWLNDPNGLVYLDGEYHLFYQFHPDSTVWGPMHWGHAVSRDLVNWQHLPVALFPDELGMIYSGSAVVDNENRAGFGRDAMVAIFTHHDPANAHQRQSLAFSTDRGRSWQKFPGNPVVPCPPETPDFRDPKVFWHEKTRRWVMVVSAGQVLHFYNSPDLVEWRLCGVFGGYGASEGVWETPDLFELPVEGSEKTRWVLVSSIGAGGPAGGSGTQYYVGRFDGETFHSENPPECVLWADFGADFYAPQSWNDAPGDRRLQIAWANNWLYGKLIPADSFRGVFTVPRQLGLRETAEGLKLVQRPVEELKDLRRSSQRWTNLTLEAGSDLLAGLEGEALEIEARFEPGPATRRVGFRLRRGAVHETVVGYDAQAGRLFVDRRRSGQSGFHPDFAGLHSVEMGLVDGQVRLHILLDRILLEVFGNDGLVALTDLIFPGPDDLGLGLFVEGGEVRLDRLDLHTLASAAISR